MKVYSLKGANTLPSIDVMVKNILDVFEMANRTELLHGADWYASAQEWVRGRADRFGIDAETVARVVSATSPGTEWSRNLKAAHGILAAWAVGASDDDIVAAGIVRSRSPGRNARRAIAILRGNNRLGPKTESFAQNISGNTRAVTVDVHAMRVALGDIYGTANGITNSAYGKVADAYRKAAEIVGLQPSVLQAITWTVCVNRRKGIN